MEIKKLGFFLLTILAPIAFRATGANVSQTLFNFNDGFQNWTPSSPQAHFEWMVTTFENLGTDLHQNLDGSFLFSKAPTDSQYRTKAWITSPEIKLGENNCLSFYAGYTNEWYDDLCRLSLLVSTDDFKTSEILWKSNYKKAAFWDWWVIEATIPKKYEGTTVKFRFLYSTGYDPNMEDRGGYFGDFAIDDFLVSSEFPDNPDNPDNPNNPDNPDNPNNPDNPDNPDNPNNPDNPDNPNNPDNPDNPNNPDNPDNPNNPDNPDNPDNPNNPDNPDNPNNPDNPDNPNNPDNPDNPDNSNAIGRIGSNEMVSIIDLNGNIIYNGLDYKSISFPKGVYILRQGYSVYKIIL